MKWANVKLIWLRELRDQLRDRRTLFTVAVLPVLLYPLMGMVLLKILPFSEQQAVRILVIGSEQLPDEPPLLVHPGNGDAVQFAGSDNATVDATQRLELAAADLYGPDVVHAEAEEAIEAGVYDAVVYFPPRFSEQLKDFRQAFSQRTPVAAPIAVSVPAPQILYDTSRDKSRVAQGRVEDALRRWRDEIVNDTFKASNIPVVITHPFDVQTSDLAEIATRRALVWSKLLPFVLMVWALTGAFYPAIDLCAGEKERGTLETLLTSPAQRSEIVWGKLLAVMSFSVATALLNLVSLGATGSFVMQALSPASGIGAQVELGPPPLACVGWLLVALLPASAMFSALALAIAAMARSSKEGQYYLMPLLLVSLPLMILPILPTAELTLGTSLVPITGLILLLRRLIEGQYAEVLRHVLPVIGVTLLCMWLSIRWAIDQFQKEEVLFRESERFTLAIWLRHLVRDRQPTPTLAMAMLFGVCLLIVPSISSLLLPVPENWGQFASLTSATLIGLIALPAILLSRLLASDPAGTLLLRRPPLLAVPAAALLAVFVQPVLRVVAEVVQFVFPIGAATQDQLEALSSLMKDAPLWALLLVIAVVPAICEELAFRGFLLSGLRRMGHRWGAIFLSAVLFGFTHGLLQQSVMATMTGVLLGLIAVQTGSLFPCIAYHFVNNGVTVLLGHVDPEVLRSNPLWRSIFTVSGGQAGFQTWFTVVCGLAAAGIVVWFMRLPHRASREEELEQALSHQSAAATS